MDGLDEIRNYCEFGDERVYLLLAIARTKENAENAGPAPTVVREVVRDAPELERKAADLEHAVGRFDRRFRLYLSANARDATTAFFELRRDMDDWLEMRLNGNEEIQGKFARIDSEYKSVLQSDRCRDETNFVFDLDRVSEPAAVEFERELERLTTVLLTRETPNGYHVVTAKFDYREIETDTAYELKTDGLIFCSYVGE